MELSSGKNAPPRRPLRFSRAQYLRLSSSGVEQFHRFLSVAGRGQMVSPGRVSLIGAPRHCADGQTLDFGLVRAMTKTYQATKAKLRTGIIQMGRRSCALATVTPYAEATHTSMRRFNMAKINRPKRNTSRLSAGAMVAAECPRNRKKDQYASISIVPAAMPVARRS